MRIRYIAAAPPLAATAFISSRVDSSTISPSATLKGRVVESPAAAR
ncbi:MAG: hypothetical protein ACKVVT_14240 [Dehalococcoidia bacterium]